MILKRLVAIVMALALLLSCAAMAEDDLSGLLEGDIVSVEDYAQTEDLPDDWWNILLLGTDNRYEMSEGSYSRTDSMIILSVNMATKQAKLTSLLRDTWVPIEGHGKNRLNACTVFGGPDLLMKTINEQFGMNISQYVMINITGLADVIDTLGGLDFAVTEAERKALNKGLFDLSSQSGMEQLEESGDCVHLNGNQAVAFARIRQIDTDYKRTERQRLVLTTMAQKLKSTTNAATIVGVVNSLLPYVETNLSLTDLMQLGYVGLQVDLDGVDQFRIPADGTFDSGIYDGIWCIKPNFEKNRSLLYDFIYGEE